ncbi:MAG: hypothetical protein CVT95_13445, partial [Bacteroidetes bacterium HGW-Bacteroidetes-12]
MNFFKNIQQKFGEFVLKSKQKNVSRHIKAIGFDKALEIGVLYDATNRNDCETVKHFVNYLI